jgi:hypothetical protein
MKYLLIALTITAFTSCQSQMPSRKPDAGGSCGGQTYKIFITGKAKDCYFSKDISAFIPSMKKELIEDNNVVTRFEYNKSKKKLTVVLYDEGDSRNFQGYLCDILRKSQTPIPLNPKP